MAVSVGYQGLRSDYALYCGKFQNSHPFTLHQHDYIEIFFNVTGEQTMLIGSELCSVHARDLVIIGCEQPHSIVSSNAGQGYILRIRPAFILQFCTDRTNLLRFCGAERPCSGHKVTLSPSEFDEILSLSRKCCRTTAKYGADILHKLYFIETMLSIFAPFQTGPDHGRLCSPQYAEFVLPVFRYVSDHLSETFSLQDVASHIGVSKCYLCRIFKSSTGTTIHQYVMTKRIERAKALLFAGKNVTEVSAEVGFNDYTYFIKAFKSMTGITPAKYVRAGGIPA